LGQMFFGESMFSRISDASKVAFFHLQEQLAVANYALIDCQMMNPHLATLGVKEMDRDDFLLLLADNRRIPLSSGAKPWATKFQSINSPISSS
jgi:leucyl/phenylalanyl-tRNA--protein transferase